MKILNDICMQLELNWIQIHWMEYEFNWILIKLNFKFNQFKFNNWIKFQLKKNGVQIEGKRYWKFVHEYAVEVLV